MPQGRMTEEQAYALAVQQRKANDLRRAGGTTGGFKGIEKPGETIRVLENGKFVYRSGSGVTDDSGPSKAPRSFLNDIGDATAKSRQVYANRDKGLTTSGQPSRDVKMKSGMSYGMGNTSKSVFGPPKAPMTGGDTLDFLRGMQGTPLGKALAYGVSLVQQSEKKGQPKDRSEYMRLLSGSEEFRKLDPESQQKVRLGMQQWFQTQSRFNPVKAMQVKKDEELNRQKAGAKQAADMISIF